MMPEYADSLLLVSGCLVHDNIPTIQCFELTQDGSSGLVRRAASVAQKCRMSGRNWSVEGQMFGVRGLDLGV
jgi:hypothetical protein